MSIEATIRKKVIALLEAVTADPVVKFGSASDEKTGAQFVVQCDRPTPSEGGRTRAGRAIERTYTLVIHAIVHSNKHREDGAKADSMCDIADAVIGLIDTETATAWLDGEGQCTGVSEQEGQYNFSETFDDFATVAELHIIPTQET